MRKGLVFAILIMTVAILTAGCPESIRSKKETTQPESPVTTLGEETEESEETTAASAEATPTPTSTPTPTPTPTLTPTPMPAHDDALWALLRRLSDFPSGTAGSSLKRAALTAAILDWAEDTDFTEEEIEADITAFSESLTSEEERKLLFGNYSVENIRDMAEDLIAHDLSALGILESSGYVPLHTSYSTVKWESFDFAFCTAYDRYLEAYPAP